MKIIRWYVIAAFLLLLFSSPAFAELSSPGIMNDVLDRFHSAASGWGGALESCVFRRSRTLIPAEVEHLSHLKHRPVTF